MGSITSAKRDKPIITDLPRGGRSVNADAYTDTGTGVVGTNMFAYCNNNPVMFVDPNGENPLAVVAGALGVSIPVLLGMGSILIFLIVILSDQHLLLSMTQALSLLIDELISIRPNVVTSKTKIPSKLKNKDGKIKTPDTNSDEFTKKKKRLYT